MTKFIEVDTDLGLRSIRIDAITTFAPSERFPSKTEIYILENASEPGYINEIYESFKSRLEKYDIANVNAYVGAVNDRT